MRVVAPAGSHVRFGTVQVVVSDHRALALEVPAMRGEERLRTRRPDGCVLAFRVRNR